VKTSVLKTRMKGKIGSNQLSHLCVISPSHPSRSVSNTRESTVCSLCTWHSDGFSGFVQQVVGTCFRDCQVGGFTPRFQNIHFVHESQNIVWQDKQLTSFQERQKDNTLEQLIVVSVDCATFTAHEIDRCLQPLKARITTESPLSMIVSKGVPS
jgi:hypothetical protein